MPVVPFLVAAGVAAGVAGGTGLALSAAAGQKKAAASASATPDASQIVGDQAANSTANANNLGRAALISTSPSGVQGIDPTGRRKLLGDD